MTYVRPLRLVIVAAALLAGCGGGATLPSGVAGTYDLRSANGQPLPYTLPTPGDETAVLAGGRLTLGGDGSFDEILRFTLTTPGQPSPTNTVAETLGDARVSGATIAFTPRLESGYTGTVGDGTITVTHTAGGDVSVTYLFVREP